MCSGRFCQALGSRRNSRALTTGTGGRFVWWFVSHVGGLLSLLGCAMKVSVRTAPCARLSDLLVGRLCMDFAEDIDAQVTTLPGGAMRRTDERYSPVSRLFSTFLEIRVTPTKVSSGTFHRTLQGTSPWKKYF